jgi:hypothetical protein
VEDLPQAAIDYVEAIEVLAGVPVTIVSVGPERNQTIFRQPVPEVPTSLRATNPTSPRATNPTSPRATNLP